MSSHSWQSNIQPVYLLILVLSQTLMMAEVNGEVSDGSLRIRGVFNSVLPGTEKRDTFKLILHPHFGDLGKHDYLRTDVGASYGLTDKWDVSAMTRYYFGNGLKEVSLFDQSDLADYQVETKFRFGHSIIPEWDTAINLAYAAPLGQPVPDVTDGLIHRQFAITSARTLKSRNDFRIFWGLTTDFISQTDVIGRVDDNKLVDSNQGITGGFVWEKGDLHYTFESSYITDRIWGSGNSDVVVVRPGIIWSVPRRYTFDSKGRWLIGAGTKISFGPDGTDIELRAKLRMDFRFNGSQKQGSKEASSEVEPAGKRRELNQ